MNELVPAVVFPPGDYLLEILNDRGWSQLDFAEIIGRSPKLVNEIIKAKTSISPTTAKEIAAATDTSPMLWLNLETAYRLHHNQGTPSPLIARRAKLRQKYPVREMAKRGWIESSSDPAVVEREVQRFFGLDDIGDEPHLYRHAAKRTGYPPRLAARSWPGCSAPDKSRAPCACAPTPKRRCAMPSRRCGRFFARQTESPASPSC